MCDSFFHDLSGNPASIAIKVKNTLLTSAKANHSLEKIILTGKRLQTDASIKAIQSYCTNNTNHDISIQFITPNPTRQNNVRVFFNANNDFKAGTAEVYAANGVKLNNTPITYEDFRQGFVILNTNSLYKGLYFVVLRNDQSWSTAKMVVIE